MTETLTPLGAAVLGYEAAFGERPPFWSRTTPEEYAAAVRAAVDSGVALSPEPEPDDPEAWT